MLEQPTTTSHPLNTPVMMKTAEASSRLWPGGTCDSGGQGRCRAALSSPGAGEAKVRGELTPPPLPPPPEDAAMPRQVGRDTGPRQEGCSQQDQPRAPALASSLQPGGNSEIPPECCPGLLASLPQSKPARLGCLTPGFHFPEASGCSRPLAHSWSRVRETSWQAGNWPWLPRLHKRGQRGGPARSAGWGKRRD